MLLCVCIKQEYNFIWQYIVNIFLEPLYVDQM